MTRRLLVPPVAILLSSALAEAALAQTRTRPNARYTAGEPLLQVAAVDLEMRRMEGAAERVTGGPLHGSRFVQT